MSKKSLFKALTETGPLIALGTALAILVSVAGPASAQFFLPRLRRSAAALGAAATA